MKKTFKTAIAIAVAIIVTKSSIAQTGLEINALYNVAVPVGGGFKGFVDKTSFGSFQASVLYGVTSHIKVGLQSSYTDFHQEVGPGSENKLQSVPLLIKGEYSFLDKGIIKPFVGLGGGVDFVRIHRERPGLRHKATHTKSGWTGDAGVVIAFAKKYGIRVSTSYNNMPLKEEDIKNVDSWNIQAGLNIHL